MILLLMLLLITIAAAQQTALTSAKMDELSAEADALVRDYADSQRRMTSKIRTRFVVLILQLMPTEMEIHRIENTEYQQKTVVDDNGGVDHVHIALRWSPIDTDVIHSAVAVDGTSKEFAFFDNIILLLETKMKIKYNSIKMRISNIITRFLEPTLIPFAMMQAPSQEEIQQALHIIESTPTAPVGGGGQIDNVTNLRARAMTRVRSPNEQLPSTDRPLQSNSIGQPSRTTQEEYVPTTQPAYQPQYTWPQASQYAQDYNYGYGSSTSFGQYYWPYQYNYQPIQQQQQYPPYYYYQQQHRGQLQAQQTQPVYYYQDQYGRIYSSQGQYLMTNYRYQV